MRRSNNNDAFHKPEWCSGPFRVMLMQINKFLNTTAWPHMLTFSIPWNPMPVRSDEVVLIFWFKFQTDRTQYDY